MKRLLIDLDKCDACPECVAACSSIFHLRDSSITSLRELATFAVVCHRCEEAPCVNSCYHKALEKDANGLIKRSRYLCTSCKSCTIACPFGVIFLDLFQYVDEKGDCILMSSFFDHKGKCSHLTFETIDIERDDLEKNIYIVSDYLAVKCSKKWFLDDTVLYKKR